MAGIVAAKILMNKRNVKGRVESSVSKVLAILDHDRQVLFCNMPYRSRKIKLMESNAKCRQLKKLTCKGTLRQVFICLMPLPLLDFYLQWSTNFVGSESGQIQSVKLLQNLVSNTTQHPPPTPSQPHTVCRNFTLT